MLSGVSLCKVATFLPNEPLVEQGTQAGYRHKRLLVTVGNCPSKIVTTSYFDKWDKWSTKPSRYLIVHILTQPTKYTHEKASSKLLLSALAQAICSFQQ